MDAYKTINDTLVHLFNEIWELEEKAIITEEFKDITNNDMHIIEAIGLGEESTMSAVARTLGITAGSLTTSMNSLVNKKYVTPVSYTHLNYVRTERGGRNRSFPWNRKSNCRKTGRRGRFCCHQLPWQ